MCISCSVLLRQGFPHSLQTSCNTCRGEERRRRGQGCILKLENCPVPFEDSGRHLQTRGRRKLVGVHGCGDRCAIGATFRGGVPWKGGDEEERRFGS